MESFANCRQATLAMGVATLMGLSADNLGAQSPAKARDFDAEIVAALRSAKTAAGFDFTGTLARTCLLPQSGGWGWTRKTSSTW